MVQIEKTKNYLRRYDSQIKEILRYFVQNFNSQNPLEKWRSGIIDRVGYLDDRKEIEYSFHGSGCTVDFNHGEIVSFDFSEDDDYEFDIFKFKVFVESTADFKKDPYDLDSVFDSLSIIKGSEGFEVNSEQR